TQLRNYPFTQFFLRVSVLGFPNLCHYPLPARDRGLRRFHPQIRCCSSHFPERNLRGEPCAGNYEFCRMRHPPLSQPRLTAKRLQESRSCSPGGGKLMHVVWWIIVGLIAGWVTGKIMGGGKGVIGDILLGIGGAVVGGWIMRLLGGTGQGGTIYTILVAIGGA